MASEILQATNHFSKTVGSSLEIMLRFGSFGKYSTKGKRWSRGEISIESETLLTLSRWPPEMTTKEGDSPKKPWKKNLYENLGYHDNYTDESFLKELKKNLHVKEVTFHQALSEAIKITEKLCVVTIFFIVFVNLHNSWVEPQTVFGQTGVVVCLCYVYYMKTRSSISYHSTVSRNVKSVCIFLMLGYILSPVLRTLTDTISTDTIYATSTFMMLVHLVSFDYCNPMSVVSSSLSLNAAIFSSVCLASRLQTSFHAFVLLAVSVELFVLYPYFRNSVMVLNLPYLCTLTLAIFSLLIGVSFIMSILFTVLLIFLNIICPMLFVHWQIYKDNIYGPWDEAVI